MKYKKFKLFLSTDENLFEKLNDFIKDKEDVKIEILNQELNNCCIGNNWTITTTNCGSLASILVVYYTDEKNEFAHDSNFIRKSEVVVIKFEQNFIDELNVKYKNYTRMYVEYLPNVGYHHVSWSELRK